jgi:hypothetical protein
MLSGRREQCWPVWFGTFVLVQPLVPAREYIASSLAHSDFLLRCTRIVHRRTLFGKGESRETRIQVWNDSGEVMKQVLPFSNKRIALGIALATSVVLFLSGCGSGSTATLTTLAQSISYSAAPSLSLHGTATVSATATSGLAVTYSSNTTGICSVDSTTGLVTDLTAGTCIIAANQPGDADYSAAPQATQSVIVTVTVTPAAQSISFGAVPSLSLLGTAIVKAAASSGLAVTYSSTTTSVCTVNNSAGLVTDLTAGTCIIAANQPGNDDYSAAAQVTQTIVVDNTQKNYNVTATFYEPQTQSYNTIFTGSFTFDSTTGTVTDLTGTLTESMYEPPITTVSLVYQLSSVSDGNGGLLVSTFALDTINVFSGGGFASGGARTYGNRNAYVMIDFNLSDPTAALTAAQIGLLTYADCTPDGMMGSDCMTGVVDGGTMGGYPISEVITLVE